MNRWFLLSVTLTVAAFGAAYYVAVADRDRLPERVPVHWGPSGAPDAWRTRDQLLPFALLPAGAMAAMVVLMRVLPWLSPPRYRVESFGDTFDYVFFLVTAMLGYIHLVVLASYREPAMDLPRWLMGGIFGFFALMGNVLGRVRPNFWMGVRTPWTLADPVVWQRTHRLAAWVFVVAGVLGVVAMLAGLNPLVGLAGILAATMIPAVYSLVLSKRLEKREPIHP